MDQTVTQLDIPAYIYNESTEVENLLIEAQMLSDEDLREEVEAAFQIKSELNTFSQSPSDSTVKFLMNYSIKLTDHIASLN